MQKIDTYVSATIKRERWWACSQSTCNWEVNARHGDMDKMTQLPPLTELAICGTDRQIFGNLMSYVQEEVPRAVDYRTETFSVGESKKASLRRWLRNWDQKDLWNINEDTWQLHRCPWGVLSVVSSPPFHPRSSHQAQHGAVIKAQQQATHLMTVRKTDREISWGLFSIQKS